MLPSLASSILGGFSSGLTSGISNGISNAFSQGASSGSNVALSASGGASQGRSQESGFGDSWSEGYGNSSNFSRTFGIEATALQKQLADEANALQRELYEDAKKYNAEQAEKNRQWQERMANTAIQRQMKDLKAAGINPILAANYMGAATPSGATASTGIATTHMANAIADSIGGGSSNNYQTSGSHNENQGTSENWSKNLGGSLSGLSLQQIGTGILLNSISDFFSGKSSGKKTN